MTRALEVLISGNWKVWYSNIDDMNNSPSAKLAADNLWLENGDLGTISLSIVTDTIKK